MSTWILIIYVGLGGDPGRAITNIPGFKSKTQCEKAGNEATFYVRTGVYFVCVKQPPMDPPIHIIVPMPDSGMSLMLQPWEVDGGVSIDL